MLTIRVGDVAVGCCPSITGCQPATGVVATGDPTHLNSGSPTSRLGDIVMFPCGGFVITIGSPTDLESGMPQATIGASCVGAGTGIVTTGNPTHLQA